MGISWVKRFRRAGIVVIALFLPAAFFDGHAENSRAGDSDVTAATWYGNRLGGTDEVLAPWKPVTVEGRSVSCWGRTYAFQAGPLPSGIVTAGEEILARPVAINVSGKIYSVSWARSQPHIALSRSAAEATVSGKLRDIRKGPMSLNITSRVEYDGLILIEITADRATQKEAGDISVEIPLKNEHSLYRHSWAPAFAGVSGNLPGGSGVIERQRFMPFYWIGDNRRGLFWFCESDEAWPNGNQPGALEVERNRNETILRLNIKKQGQRLPPKWRLVFGLQATPVKPLPAGWRTWRLDPARNAKMKIMWPEPRRDSLRYYGYPEASDPALFRSRVHAIQQKEMKAVPYLCLTHLSVASPEWAAYRHEWSVGKEDAVSDDVAVFGAPFAMVSPRGRGWSDFIIWKTREFMDSYGIDGLYHDNTQPYEIAEPGKGLGYLSNWKKRRAFPILGYRDIYRRMYAVLKSSPRQTFSIAHMSGKVTIPVLAFEDAYLDGEQLLGKVKDDYLDVLPLDAFRAEFMGRQWGVVPYFLPEFRPPYMNQVRPTRGLMALLMLHDVAPWPNWCNVSVVNTALAALDEFGYADAEFIPYFDPVPPATADVSNVYVSAYRKAGGEMLLIAANLGKRDVNCTVAVARPYQPKKAGLIINWPDRSELKPVNDRLPLSLEGQSYKFIVIGNAV